jgi:hypothetical protein
MRVKAAGNAVDGCHFGLTITICRTRPARRLGVLLSRRRLGGRWGRLAPAVRGRDEPSASAEGWGSRQPASCRRYPSLGSYSLAVGGNLTLHKKRPSAARLGKSGGGIIYGVVLTGFTAAESEGQPWVATKKLWSYMLRYMRPAISAALGPNVGRPPCKKTTTTTRPMLVLA